jgi:hypothetical protein
MSKYRATQKKEFVRPYKIHPIWRGIGFAIIIIIPIVGWAATQELVTLVQGWDAPQVQSFVRSLSSPFKFPPWVSDIPFLRDMARWIRSIPMLKLQMVFFFFVVLILSSILSIVYSIVYRAAVPLYGPLDEPAPKIRAKKYTR